MPSDSSSLGGLLGGYTCKRPYFLTLSWTMKHEIRQDSPRECSPEFMGDDPLLFKMHRIV